MSRTAVFIDGGYLQKSVLCQWGKVSLDLLKLSDNLVGKINGGERLRSYFYDCPPYQGEPSTEDERRRTANFDRFKTKVESLPRFLFRAGRLQRYPGLPPRRWYRQDDGTLIEIFIVRHPDTERYEGFAIQRGDFLDAGAPEAGPSRVLASVTSCSDADAAEAKLSTLLGIANPPERASALGLYRFDQKRVDMLLGMDLVLHASKQHITHAVLITGDSDFIPAVQMARENGVLIALAHSEYAEQRPHRDLFQICDERIPLDDALIQSCLLRGPESSDAGKTALLKQPATPAGQELDALVAELERAERRLPFVGLGYFGTRWSAPAPCPPPGKQRFDLIQTAAARGLVEIFSSDSVGRAIRVAKKE